MSTSELVSFVVPIYNEEENVQAMADALRETFKKDLPAYRYEILFIDNDSKDRTREIIRKLCAEDKGIKGIFNAKLKRGKDCVSNHFPLRLNGENGGGEMPYCIYFYTSFKISLFS